MYSIYIACMILHITILQILENFTTDNDIKKTLTVEMKHSGNVALVKKDEESK